MSTHPFIERLVARYPDLVSCLPDLQAAYKRIILSYQSGGKLLVCGNGGSAADSDHIVGELMKGFLRRRPLPADIRQKLLEADPSRGEYLADHLQGALPAISLSSQSAFLSAYANDVAADMGYAQQVYGYGCPGDVLFAISTSGNSKNVLHALEVARVMGLHSIGLTGNNGGAMLPLCNVAIRVPAYSVPDIQERHLSIYHALCAEIEAAFFEE